jgi:hypothetical protein
MGKVNRLVHSSFVGALLIAATLSTGACGGSGGAPTPDPAGTVATSVNYTAGAIPIELFRGPSADAPYLYGGSIPYPYVVISFGILSSMNFSFHTAAMVRQDAVGNPDWYGLGNFGGEVADAGPVSGLGDVTEKPASGWSSAASVEVGHGYVARFRKSTTYGISSQPYVYARVYVVEYLISSTSGGVIGAKLRYQTPF